MLTPRNPIGCGRIDRRQEYRMITKINKNDAPLKAVSDWRKIFCRQWPLEPVQVSKNNWFIHDFSITCSSQNASRHTHKL